jgi:hypothetical protein
VSKGKDPTPSLTLFYVAISGPRWGQRSVAVGRQPAEKIAKIPRKRRRRNGDNCSVAACAAFGNIGAL